MKVLYLSHTAAVSGGERSLLDLLGALPSNVTPVVASPEGELALLVRTAGVHHELVIGTAGSLSLHWRRTPRAVAEMLAAARQVNGLVKRYRTDLVHANSIRAGIIGGLAGLGRGAPLVTHVRDVLPDSAVSRACLRFVGARSQALVANSQFTNERNGLPERCGRVEVVHSPVDLSKFDPSRVDRAASRAALNIVASDLTLGIVGQITPWKGQLEAIETLGVLVARGVSARLFVAGSTTFVDEATRYDNRAYEARLEQRIGELGLRERVHMLGRREDVPEIMAALDLVLVPSWEEPMGRTVLEGMAMGRPVVTTALGGPAELMVDGVHGRVLQGHRPQEWADALQELAEKPRLLEEMGRGNRNHVERLYGLEASTQRLMDLYASVIRGGPAPAR